MSDDRGRGSDFERETRERLDALERRLRRWRGFALASAGLAVLALAGAMAGPVASELVVKKVRVVDDKGRNRIVLSADPTEPDFNLFDPSGKSRLTIDVAEDRRPIVQFVDADNEESGRLVLGLEEGGLPSLSLYGGSGRKRVSFGIPREGGPVIRVLDEHGRLQMRFP